MAVPALSWLLQWTSSSSTGGAPANFLDVGGGANEKQVQAAFEIFYDAMLLQLVLSMPQLAAAFALSWWGTH